MTKPDIPEPVATLLRELAKQANDAHAKARDDVNRIRARADDDIVAVWDQYRRVVDPIDAERRHILDGMVTIANHESPRPIVAKKDTNP